MLSDAQVERYSRQIVLPEVGGRGQERILASSVSIHGEGDAARTCASYLAAAGVGRVALGSIPTPTVAIWIDAPPPGDAAREGTVVLWGAVKGPALTRVRFPPGQVCGRCLEPFGSEHAAASGGAHLLGTLLAAEALRALVGLPVPRGAEVLTIDIDRTTITTRPLPSHPHS